MTDQQWLWTSSGMMGTAVGAFVYGLLSIVFRSRLETALTWEFESTRRIQLRLDSTTFRWFEPLIDERARSIRQRRMNQLDDLEREIAASKESPHWKPEELIAAKQIESVGAGLVGLLFGYAFEGPLVAVVMGIGCAWFFQKVMIQNVSKAAQKRIDTIKLRLPFAIDLMAFMMEAGASFMDSVLTVVNENREHPLGEEFAEVNRQIALGRSRQMALEQFQERLPDEDVKEFVFAINNGEEMGTPLSSILRIQADQMRLKRSQWAEKAAAEAQISIVFPGMLIMLACLVIVMAPFVLEFMQQGQN